MDSGFAAANVVAQTGCTKVDAVATLVDRFMEVAAETILLTMDLIHHKVVSS